MQDLPEQSKAIIEFPTSYAYSTKLYCFFGDFMTVLLLASHVTSQGMEIAIRIPFL